MPPCLCRHFWVISNLVVLGHHRQRVDRHPRSVVVDWTGSLVLVFGLDSPLLFQMEKNATKGTLLIQDGPSLSLGSAWLLC